MEKIFYLSKYLAVGWFIVMLILFVLPGSALPEEHWMNQMHLDKLVHCVLFGGLVFLWSPVLKVNTVSKALLLIAVSIIYGLLVEFIQKAWIAGRTFDLYDVVADGVGSVLGWIVWLKVYKKINPCRNRGRNQN